MSEAQIRMSLDREKVEAQLRENLKLVQKEQWVKGEFV